MYKLKLKIQEKIIKFSTVTIYDIADTLTLIAGTIMYLFSLSIAVADRLSLFVVPEFLNVIGICLLPCGIFLFLIGLIKKLSCCKDN
jgi:hypothetical protein